MKGISKAQTMDPTLAKKLERLKYYATRYEIIAKGPKGERLLVMYGPKSKRQIRAGLTDDNFKRLNLLAAATGTKTEDWFAFTTGVTCGAWSVMPSGRTQREAYIEGELLSIFP